MSLQDKLKIALQEDASLIDNTLALQEFINENASDEEVQLSTILYSMVGYNIAREIKTAIYNSSEDDIDGALKKIKVSMQGKGIQENAIDMSINFFMGVLKHDNHIGEKNSVDDEEDIVENLSESESDDDLHKNDVSMNNTLNNENEVNNIPIGEVETWTCSCGQVNHSKYCVECGKPKDETLQWKCECGATNVGKYCSECGKSKSSKRNIKYSKYSKYLLFGIIVIAVCTLGVKYLGVSDSGGSQLPVIISKVTGEDKNNPNRIGTIGGIKLRDSTIYDVAKTYGEPDYTRYATQYSDCYSYGGSEYAPFEVFYNRETRTITGIIVRQGSYISTRIETSKGIMIYDTKENMLAKYGQPVSIEKGDPGIMYIYEEDGEKLTFWIVDDKKIVAFHSTVI